MVYRVVVGCVTCVAVGKWQGWWSKKGCWLVGWLVCPGGGLNAAAAAAASVGKVKPPTFSP